jgi:2,5-diketo-D-gluconate reductase A
MLAKTKEKDVIDQLLDQIDFHGMTAEELAGENGLLKKLTSRFYSKALDAEMDEHLGYKKNDNAGDNSGNSRNGYTTKTVITDDNDTIEVHVPRDIQRHLQQVYGAWRALEEFYEKGILKAIGISNFYADRMVEFASFNRIKPMVNQVECHPLNQQIEAKKWNDKYGIQLEAWAPFGEGRGGLFENPVLKEIAAAHGKTTAQVMLRWHLQRGIVVIPKSTHKERMAENLNVFDFTLTAEEMAKITALDTATSSFFSHQDPAMVEWFVKMVEERKKQQDSSKEKKAW